MRALRDVGSRRGWTDPRCRGDRGEREHRKLLVTATEPIDDAAVLAAVDEAGYSAVRV
jgi:hypothetical protein